MGEFDRDYLTQLRDKFGDVLQRTVEEQASLFKERYVLSIEDDVLAIDDRVQMYLRALPNGQQSFSFNDPNLTKFLENCQVAFDSFQTRNKEFNVLNLGNQKLSFLEFLLYDYRDRIVNDYCQRWGTTVEKMMHSNHNMVKITREEALAQMILSELLIQPPFGVDPELDKLIKEEREKLMNHKIRVTQLQARVTEAESKFVKSVQDKKAIQELAILEQTNIEEELTFLRTQINKRTRKVLMLQREALRELYTNGYFDFANKIAQLGGMIRQNSAQNNRQPLQQQQPSEKPKRAQKPLPPGWAEYEDDNTGNLYYHNEGLNLTQWDRPV